MQKKNPSQGYFRISDVSRLVGISPSVLRTWESAGLVSPRRTRSRYRLFSPHDIEVLKRAHHLRRAQGMNTPAIVHLLRTEGLLEKNGTAKPVPVGLRLRRLRLHNGYSLSHVAQAAGVSVGFLSALERGHMSASISTLSRVARFFKVNILSLFNPSRVSKRRVQPAERKVLDNGSGVRMELLAWGDAVMEPHLFRIAPGSGSGDSYEHEGEEFLFVIRGTLEITLEDGQPERLNKGDSFYFKSNMRHHWRNPGQNETHVLWVNTPPTF